MEYNKQQYEIGNRLDCWQDYLDVKAISKITNERKRSKKLCIKTTVSSSFKRDSVLNGYLILFFHA